MGLKGSDIAARPIEAFKAGDILTGVNNWVRSYILVVNSDTDGLIAIDLEDGEQISTLGYTFQLVPPGTTLEVV